MYEKRGQISSVAQAQQAAIKRHYGSDESAD